jgi:uroporphyrinogen-III decarboxylase
VQFVAGQPGLVALGMAIGPFSLMTKLLKDPISAVALACGGLTGEEDPEVLLAERALRMAEATVLRSARAQIAAGAKAMLICEPAANIVYLSPRHMRRDPEVLERWILGPNRRLAQLLESHDVDLIFHDCGELEEEMVRRFAAELRPKVLSLGSSRSLWEDAALVAPDIVLYGNLPTKTFYSDSSMPVEEVRRRTRELVERMRACGHPHILGSECDVLHVPDADATIRRKVDEMLSLEV